MSEELAVKLKEYNKEFDDLMKVCGVDSYECEVKAVEQPKKRVNLFIIFVALVALLISCSATY